MALTIAQCRSFAKNLLNIGGTSEILTSEWLEILNIANREVWRMVVDANPSHHQIRTAITWPANTESLDISGASYLNAAVYRIVQIEVFTSASATITPTNLPSHKLRPVPFADRVSALGGGQAWPEVTSAGYPWGYWITGETTVGLLPVAGVGVALGVSYVPSLAVVTDDTNQALGGKADDFHDAVAYRAADLANSKSRGANPTIGRLWAEAQAKIAGSGTREQDEPRYVRRVRRY